MVGGDAIVAERAVEPLADDATGALEQQAEVGVEIVSCCDIVEVAFQGKKKARGCKFPDAAARGSMGVTMPADGGRQLRRRENRAIRRLVPAAPPRRREALDDGADFVVGLLVPINGSAGIWGPSSIACAQLAQAEINADGGLLDRQPAPAHRRFLRRGDSRSAASPPS